ncbi:MAG: hypothetical protein H6672_19045 [Anaerolineaceae bacterium]|nr:hypothetical protein [Anaerolineaceae bacterium]
MADEPHSILTQVVTKIFQRIIRSEYDYDRDMQSLQDMLKRANKLNLPTLERRVLNCMAALNLMSGHLDQAEEAYQQLYQLHEAAGQEQMMVVPLSNLAVISRVQGDFTAALTVYDRGIKLLTDSIERNIRAYLALSVGKIATLTHLFRFQDAKQLFQEISQQADKVVEIDALEYARIIVEAQICMVMVALHEGNTEEAEDFARQALERTEQLNLPVEQASATFALGRVALHTSEENNAKTFFEKGVSLLEATSPSVSVADAYLQEARLLDHLGHKDSANTFLSKAVAIFTQMGIEDAQRYAHL